MPPAAFPPGDRAPTSAPARIPPRPVVAVMAYRESAEPIARGIGGDSLPWWKLADSVWVRVDATVAGGACNELRLIRVDD